MRHLHLGLWAIALLALFSVAAPAKARTAEATTVVRSPRYDASKEVTLDATVTSVATKSSEGMGSHVMLATRSGELDGSLGNFALRGNEALAITVGKQLKVTGAMMEMRGKEVFVIRTVEMDGHVYNIRNERGFALEHPARNISTGTEPKGAQR